MLSFVWCGDNPFLIRISPFTLKEYECVSLKLGFVGNYDLHKGTTVSLVIIGCGENALSLICIIY